ncbi:MAG TPA: hypothetical protein VFG86_05595, partial [Chloroflexota bacterium]|nr:hypothetical protein [Chloroflexota bacterium]
MDGMLPGLRVQVRDGAAVIGQSPAAGAAVHVGVSPAFVAGHSISARQMHCGNPGPDTPGMTVGPSKERRQGLPAPEVGEPLFACQQAAAIYGCTPGCQADLFVGLVANASACCAGAAVSLWVSGGLVQGASITARQSLCGNSIQSPMSPAVLVQPATNIPRPAIWPPLYEGDTNVAVAMTVSGETVTLKADSTQIGMGGAGGGNAVFNVDPPLRAGQHVVATVELCAVKKDSLPLTVLPRPVTIPPPKILKPLNACSLLVNVVDCIAGAEVRVFAEAAGNKVLLGVGKAYGIALTVNVTPALKVGWSVTATQKVGGVTSPASAAVGVQAAPPPTPASLATPIYACARCVLVKGTLAGARVDVFQNTVWVGGANATGTVTHVEVYPGLGSGTTITVTQTVCGKASKATSALTKAGPEKIAPPNLLPAYAGRAYVEAGGLVPGAVVEVEETSVYHMVIGKQCVTDQTATIGLNLPLFVGARLRARQRLCKASEYSPTIVVSEPIEWPLGAGPFKAGFRLPSDIPISADVTFTWSEEGPCNGGTYRFEKPAQNKAVVYYPATADGANAAFAAGGPFPLIVYA